MDRTGLAHGSKGRVGRPAQRDQVPGCAVAVHFNRLVQLRIEAEADEQDPVPVDLQLGPLANCLAFSAASGCRPRLVAMAGPLSS